ncbi:unnamed protein product [Amoebophrya sp. A120]|nr:unnamed protein product [Amoebophrya sp. A120]|eukprot:GSA120T00005847001.1
MGEEGKRLKVSTRSVTSRSSRSASCCSASSTNPALFSAVTATKRYPTQWTTTMPRQPPLARWCSRKMVTQQLKNILLRKQNQGCHRVQAHQELTRWTQAMIKYTTIKICWTPPRRLFLTKAIVCVPHSQLFDLRSTRSHSSTPQVRNNPISRRCP